MKKVMKGAWRVSITIGLASINLFCAETPPNFTIRRLNPSDTKIVYLFAHGLGANQQQSARLFSRIKEQQPDNSFKYNTRWIIDEPIALFDFPDAKNDNNEYYNEYVNLGQKQDIERLKHAYEKILEKHPDAEIILVGVSRGSVAIINFIATYQPDHVRALILESPFDTLKNIIKHMLERFHVSWIPFSNRIAYKIAQKYFPSLDLKGIVPLDVVEKLPYNVPIIIVHSKKDRVIPIKSSRKLYLNLKQTGHDHVHLLELKSGNHGKIIHGADGDYYQNVVHAFYEKYNLPYDKQCAKHGRQFLSSAQPSISEILIRMKKKRTTGLDDTEDELESGKDTDRETAL